MRSVKHVRNETIVSRRPSTAVDSLLQVSVHVQRRTFGRSVPYWLSNAPETDPAPARPHADVLRHRHPDPRHRHRRQHRHLQRRPGHSAEAPAVSAVGRGRHDRSLGAGHQPAERWRGSLPLFHVSRTGTDVSGRRVVEHRDGQRHRTRRTRGSADAVRHRRGFADPRRAAAAGASVLEIRRGGRRARDGHPHVGILAVEVRRRIIGHRPDADARQQTARSDRRAPGDAFDSSIAACRSSSPTSSIAARRFSDSSASTPSRG